jgi:putative SOS response-associated peptidase YedK
MYEHVWTCSSQPTIRNQDQAQVRPGLSGQNIPAFRDAWKKGQRCLVVTDGFYEWKNLEKQPNAVAMADGSQMVIAGLWDEWTDKKRGSGLEAVPSSPARLMGFSAPSMIGCR